MMKVEISQDSSSYCVSVSRLLYCEEREPLYRPYFTGHIRLIYESQVGVLEYDEAVYSVEVLKRKR